MAMDVLRDYIEHEKTLIAQIEHAVKQAHEGSFASDEQARRCAPGALARMRIEWLAKALKNLEDEANYIALENPKAADDVRMLFLRADIKPI
ncbi:Ribbon-helix-helix protein domain-containing protein [Pseudomonas syringae pv. maculicola]|nr:Ribbon-helix-helix protein domain-containing protein [Pseudomonas syringae pv. maculicola]